MILINKEHLKIISSTSRCILIQSLGVQVSNLSTRQAMVMLNLLGVPMVRDDIVNPM